MIPDKCNGCGEPLLLANLYVDDGCPCNARRGVNFEPRRCLACKCDDCVKPGHHLAALYCDIRASSTAMAHGQTSIAIALLNRWEADHPPPTPQPSGGGT